MADHQNFYGTIQNLDEASTDESVIEGTSDQNPPNGQETIVEAQNTSNAWVLYRAPTGITVPHNQHFFGTIQDLDEVSTNESAVEVANDQNAPNGQETIVEAENTSTAWVLYRAPRSPQNSVTAQSTETQGSSAANSPLIGMRTPGPAVASSSPISRRQNRPPHRRIHHPWRDELMANVHRSINHSVAERAARLHARTPNYTIDHEENDGNSLPFTVPTGEDVLEGPASVIDQETGENPADQPPPTTTTSRMSQAFADASPIEGTYQAFEQAIYARQNLAQLSSQDGNIPMPANGFDGGPTDTTLETLLTRSFAGGPLRTFDRPAPHSLADVLQFMDSLVEVPLDELDEDSRTCRICWAAYETDVSLDVGIPEKAVRLPSPCNHVFGNLCLRKLLTPLYAGGSGDRFCPLCRREIKVVEEDSDSESEKNW